MVGTVPRRCEERKIARGWGGVGDVLLIFSPLSLTLHLTPLSEHLEQAKG